MLSAQLLAQPTGVPAVSALLIYQSCTHIFAGPIACFNANPLWPTLGLRGIPDELQEALQKARHDQAQWESRIQELQRLLDQSRLDIMEYSAQKESLQQQLNKYKATADLKIAEVTRLSISNFLTCAQELVGCRQTVSCQGIFNILSGL